MSKRWGNWNAQAGEHCVYAHLVQRCFSMGGRVRSSVEEDHGEHSTDFTDFRTDTAKEWTLAFLEVGLVLLFLRAKPNNPFPHQWFRINQKSPRAVYTVVMTWDQASLLNLHMLPLIFLQTMFAFSWFILSPCNRRLPWLLDSACVWNPSELLVFAFETALPLSGLFHNPQLNTRRPNQSLQTSISIQTVFRWHLPPPRPNPSSRVIGTTQSFGKFFGKKMWLLRYCKTLFKKMLLWIPMGFIIGYENSGEEPRQPFINIGT